MTTKPKSDKELADELDARERLRKRGATWETCKQCHGVESEGCVVCRGRGGYWEFPLWR